MKNTAKKLGAGVTFSAQQAIPAILLVLFSFFKTAAVALNEAGASVDFLTGLHGAYIPQVLTGTAVLYFLISAALFSVREKVRAPSLVVAAAAAISLIFYLIVRLRPDLYRVCAAQMIWKNGFTVLMETAFWITAFRFGVFHDKHKTLTAVVAAQICAAVVTAGFIRLLAALNAADTLTAWACVSAFAAGAAAEAFINNGSAPVTARFAFSKQAAKSTGENHYRKTLNLRYFTVAALMTFCAALFDYRFLSSTASEYALSDKGLPVLFALLSLLSGLIAAAGLFISAKGHVAVLTLSVLFLAPAAFLTGAAGGFYGVFGLIVAAKAVLDAVSVQAKEPVMNFIPRAVSLRLDFRTNVWRKAAVEPLSLLAAGLTLTALERYGAIHDFTPLFAASILALLVSLLFLRRAYTVVVSEFLKNRLWRGGRLMIFGKLLNGRINDFLENPSPDDTIYALRILEEAQHPAFPDALEQALSHPSRYVRLFALERIEAMRFISTLDEVARRAENDEDYAVRRAALKVMCLLGGTEEREKALTYLDNPEMREGALIGLTAAGAEGVFVAIDMLNMLANSKSAQERALAASVLGDAGNQAFYRPLAALMTDEDAEVCRAAGEAAGKLKNIRLLPSLMSLFRRPELREDAVAALLQFGNAALPEMETAMKDAENPVQFRILLAKTIGRIATPEAEALLFRNIAIRDRRVRYHILKALVFLNFKAQGRAATEVRLGLYDEIEWSTGLLAALEDFEDQDDDRLGKSLDNLRGALENEIEFAKERILLLVALLHPSAEIVSLLNRYALTTEEERAEMSAIIEKTLTGELRMLYLPLFRKTSPTEKLTHLRPYFMPPILTFRDRIADLLSLKSGDADDWTRASTVYLAGYFGEPSSVGAILPLLSDNNAIVRETAVWALGRLMMPEEAKNALKDCLNDPVPAVARMARFITDGTGRIFL